MSLFGWETPGHLLLQPLDKVFEDFLQIFTSRLLKPQKGLYEMIKYNNEPIENNIIYNNPNNKRFLLVSTPVLQIKLAEVVGLRQQPNPLTIRGDGF